MFPQEITKNFMLDELIMNLKQSPGFTLATDACANNERCVWFVELQ